MPSRPASSRLLARIRSSSCVYCLYRQRPVPVSRPASMLARPGFAVHRDPCIGNRELPAGFSRVICAVRLSTDSVCVCSRPTSWHRPVSARRHRRLHRFVDRHPAFKGELCRFQRNIACIHLPSHGFRSMSSAWSQTDHCLTTPHHRANPCAPASRRLSGKAGEAYQAFCTVSTWIVSQVSCGIASSAR